MFKNHIKVALRNLLKNRSYSLINIIGLTVGITCCLLISLYVKHELGYDKFQLKGDRLTRVIMEYNMGGVTNGGNYTSTKVGPSFKRNFPEVEQFARLTGSQRIVKYNDKVFTEKRFIYADSTFFELFSFKLIEGNIANVLVGPNKVVLTKSTAEKYFGDQNPVGKTLNVSSNGTAYLVTGIMEDCPENSHIKFDFIASFSSLGDSQEKTYWNANYTTYLLLRDKQSILTLQQKIPGFMKNEMKDELTGNDYLTYYFEPFTRVHLYSEYSGFETNGSIVYVYIVSAIALLLLVIACFTFINLCTAKSMERAREIGIRKVAGAAKSQIFWQFIGESFVLTCFSALMSYFTARLALPYFNALTARNLHFPDLFSFSMIGLTGLVVLSVSFFAGTYPALILSAFQPVKVLKGIHKNTTHGLFLRKSLFVFQFIISIFLIASSFVIQKQLAYFQTKKLGFDKAQLLVLPADGKVIKSFSSLKAELKKYSSVISVSKADFLPCNILGGYSMYKQGMAPGKAFSVFAGGIDQEYLKTCGIRLIAGNDLSEMDVENATHENAEKNYFQFIINESAARQLGWKTKDAVGKKLFLDASRPGVVKGVVADFHFSSLHTPIKPLVLFPGDYGTNILVKLSNGDPGESLKNIEKVWKQVAPHRPFEYSFLDDNYNAMYVSEKNLGKAVTTFTYIALLLAIMGLIGLSSYSIQQRAKEIGILKVLGAPLYVIISRLIKNFVSPVLLAVIIASPIAWWTSNIWLRDFSYRINLNVWMFILPAFASVFLAVLAVSIKALLAATANPIKNLRTE